MRKITSAVFMIVAVMTAIFFSLTSCSSDDDNQDQSTSSIVGKWKAVSISPEEGEQANGYAEYFEFKANGEFVGFINDDTNKPVAAKWTQPDNSSVIITINMLPLPWTWNILKLDETTLIVKFKEFVDLGGAIDPSATTYTVTFQRVK